MDESTRRSFLQHTGLGLAGLGVGGLVLRAGATPSPPIVNGNEANRILIQMGNIQTEVPSPKELKRVTPVVFGPFYRTGAPFRAKLSLPGEAGATFVLRGRAWAYDTKRPLPGVVLDFWHVDMQEKYSDGVNDFRNRGRVVTSETGYYEVEGIRPIPYRPNPVNAPNFWRCAHFHLLAVCPGYKQLVTEIHFKDDPKMADPMYRPETLSLRKSEPSTGFPLKPRSLMSSWIEKDKGQAPGKLTHHPAWTLKLFVGPRASRPHSFM